MRGPADVGSPAFVRATRQLQRIRQSPDNVFYAYVLRPTATEGVFEYVVDADSMDPDARIDLNHDGTIDDADALNYPGQEFDAADIPALREQAIDAPTTDAEPLSSDSYGTFLSAYAPIKKDGRTVGILCLDVEVSDYLRLINLTFLPFAAFVIALLGLLTVLTALLMQLWGRQVSLVEEVDRQKDEVLGIVAHQLFTPITAARWSSENLLAGDAGPLTAQQREEVLTIQSVAAHLVDLVTMILDVSRIQLGRVPIKPAPLDLAAMFREVLSVIEIKAKEKAVRFKASMPDFLPVVLLDGRYTRMTVENLLTNAVKYTPAGGAVDLSVQVSVGAIRVTVRDTGCGIPRSEQGKIFGKLFRASNVRNSVEGNGFGLYVAKGAVEAQGGRIWFESEEGKGTTFHVELPHTPIPSPEP